MVLANEWHGLVWHVLRMMACCISCDDDTSTTLAITKPVWSWRHSKAMLSIFLGTQFTRIMLVSKNHEAAKLL
jgi:hypothetical protein